MEKRIKYLYEKAVILFLFVALAACSPTKYIPEEQYLLNRVSLKTDSTVSSKVNLLDFIKQQPNDPKIGLMIYNMVDGDSSRFKRMIRKIGEPPVIFNPNAVNQSINELSIEMKNRGYLNSYVHAKIDTLDKKIEVEYHIHENYPYRVRNYSIRLPNEQMTNLALGIRPENVENKLNIRSAWQNRRWGNFRNPGSSTFKEPVLKTGTIFDMTTLEQEMNRVSNILRNRGYYASAIDDLHYLADTTLRCDSVDVTLLMKDETRTQIFRIEKVKVFSGYDPSNRRAYKIADSLDYEGIRIYYDSLRFLRPGVIADKVLVRPGGLFRERAGISTTNLFSALNCVERADLMYVEGNYPDSTLLDCEIFLTPGEVYSLQTGLSGTNKAGDLGIAADITYGHQNLFNGSELFNLGLRGAYEFVSGEEYNNSINHNFYEFRITPSMSFSSFHFPWLHNRFKYKYNPQTKYELGLNIQRRPEYIREFFNFSWQFRWASQENILTQTFSLLDINYVAMPWKSELFSEYLNNRLDSLTKFSYQNVFTAGINYNLIYTNANVGKLHERLYTVRFNAESSGNALHGIFSLANMRKNEAGQYIIGSNPFAQYVKADIDFAQTFPLSTTSGVAFHAAVGAGLPYRNSTILPFEKRYYAGGPNSVRGWRTRYLGPGSFNRGVAGDPTTHVGDISFIFSTEYRYKVLKWLEPAFFVDCGNIWTIKNYPNQAGGLFQWNSFYKELAIGTGVGLRFDLTFLILRIDAGTQIYDPAKQPENRFVFMKGNFWNKSAMYVAIGYPF
jgi:outer membrane protein assembly factor BamA